MDSKIQYFNKPITVHTARTLMFSELSKVMDSAIHDSRYLDSLKENIASKQTKSNQKRTDSALISLYKFGNEYAPFLCFKHYWQSVDDNEKAIITLLFAICNDYLLSDSVSVILSTVISEKVSKLKLEENIDNLHPNRFTNNTRSSATRNIISSWRQAGYVSDNKASLRIQPIQTNKTVAFAFLMSYLNGDRGEFILTSKWVKALGIGESQIHDLAIEAGRRDLLQYQYAGSVTTISFTNLFKTLHINV